MMVFQRWPAARTVSLLIERDGRVLLVRRGREARMFLNTWSLPGGDVRPGETIHEAARRIARDALGIEAGGLHLEREFPAPSPFQDSRGDDAVLRVLSYGSAIVDAPGRIAWFAADDLAGIVIFRETRDALRALLHTETMARAH